MTSFHIKLLAAVLMVIDHVGEVFFPKILWFRVIGRLSFPLFAWLLGQGEKHTKNFPTYLFRLIILGIISQPIYYLLFQDYRANILATLALGLAAIRLDKLANTKFLFALVMAVIAQLLDVSYGAYGVLLVTILAELKFDSAAWWVKWILLNLLTLLTPRFAIYQVLALITPGIIGLWNGKQGRKARWFYTFYPLHLALLFVGELIITAFLNNSFPEMR